MLRPEYGLFALLIPLFACQNENTDFAGSGVFEAHEIIVSAEGNGLILEFRIEEGNSVLADSIVGHLDCKDLVLQKSQVEASREALKLKRVESNPETAIIQKQLQTQQNQIGALEVQYAVLIKDRDRIQKLVAQDAAPTKQLDDLQGNVDVMEKQISGARAQLAVLQQQIQSAERSASLKNRSIMSEDDPLQSQIARIENLIDNCTIVNPINGTVIAKYVEPFEFITAGKPLYKVADLGEMTLRAYLSGDQLTGIKLGDTVTVRVDAGSGEFRAYDAVISWIAGEAEFTPKTIQTKDERANLVYAVKVSVKNDGYLRIGMYGELDF